MSYTTKKTGLELLREPFPAHQISLLPKPYKKESPKGNCNVCGGYHGLPAAHLEYVGHAALTDRLLEADPLWTWEPLALDENGLPRFDKNGGLWIRLTVSGHTRLGYGNAENSNFKEVGAREKEVIGDALRNAAMRFGAALDLWHKGDLRGGDEAEKAPVKAPESPAVERSPQKTAPDTPEPLEPSQATARQVPSPHSQGLSEAQWKRAQAIAHKAGWDKTTLIQSLLKVCKEGYGVNFRELSKFDYDELCKAIEQGAQPQEIITAKRGGKK